MTTTKLKELIKDKFESMAKFAKLIKIDRYELQKFFAAAEKKMTPERKTRIAELAKLARETKNTAVETDLTPELRKKISAAIEEQFGGVSDFCEKNPAFNPFSIWQVINGRRKTISRSVKKMLEILKINPNEKTERTLA